MRTWLQGLSGDEDYRSRPHTEGLSDTASLSYYDLHCISFRIRMSEIDTEFDLLFEYIKYRIRYTEHLLPAGQKLHLRLYGRLPHFETILSFERWKEALEQYAKIRDMIK